MSQDTLQSVADGTSVFLGMPAVIASEPMVRLMAAVERVARSSATVLITGESGTGKELVARAVHHYSLRSQKPWVDLSCAALPEHLLESELFGYDKGAFSGADSMKPGLFEMAHQGTIFLDEIGELDLKMQVKLLRVLDGVAYYRLGGVKKISVDVRVVAATNRPLEEAVAEGRFRSDLYHRLSQITLQVPPLRARIEDVLPLAVYFLAQNDSRMRFSESAAKLLLAYAWPGNIRELRNVVTKAAVMARSLEIRPDDLASLHSSTPPDIWQRSRSPGTATNLGLVERRTILEALSATGGHQQKAAERLGISRRTLSRKLKLYESARLEAAS
ncbi:MAG: sigma-54 dependent transcriptional regulator [Bryobacteraceae bacterium]|jgi:transcriptional regulator with PAS, ATPase and Fis domain